MDGMWHDWTINDREGSHLSLAPIFEAEVVHDNDGSWRAMLNGQRMGMYPTRDMAKARCDWEVWNRVRCFKPGYLRLLDRRDSWKDGSS